MKKTILVLMLLCTGVFAFEAFDDFNRPNNQSLDTGNWFKPNGALNKVIVYDSSIIPTWYSTTQAHWIKPFGSNQYAQIKISRLNTGYIILYLHGGNTISNNRYSLQIYKDSLSIFKNGIKLVKYNHIVVDGDIIRFSSYGDSLFVHDNNVQVFSVFDNDFRTGYIGAGLNGDVNNNRNKADDFIGGTYYPTYFDNIIGTPAIIAQQPKDTAIDIYDTARFHISATGDNLTYQWFIDDTLINGAISSDFKFYASTKYNHSKIYCQLFTDTLITSDTVELIVNQYQPNIPNYSLRVLTWDVDKAYPGIEYNFRLGVIGGEYPYTFTLQHGPTGMTINKTTGEILWTPESATLDSVRVKIVDMKGDSLIHRYNIEATTSGFYFVDSATGSNSNDGSEAHPWLTMAYASATADSVSYVYVKTGTYNETFSIAHNNCGRFLAYPGDSVKVMGVGTGSGSIWINGGTNLLFQGFTFDANDHRWLFSVGGGGYVKKIIWRKNKMHNCYSNDTENPAFIFFWDGTANPITEGNGYRFIVVQDNVFNNLRNVNNHGASITMYDVQDMLYEDNVVSDIDGNGITDKDEGYMNTIRHNVIDKCNCGVGLGSQYAESGDEINYNLIYNCNTAVTVGSQPGYLENVFIHHNTLLGGIFFRYVLTNTNSININVYKNIIGKGGKYPYSVEPITIYDTSIVNDTLKITYYYDYPYYFKAVDSKKILIDSNIIWSTIDADSVAGYGWGIPATNWVDWRNRGFDNNSLLMQLSLDSNYLPILPDSLKYGYGHLTPSGMHPAIITAQPQSITKKSGETATFLVTATGTGLTYQWYGNNSLIEGATSSTYSFTAAKIYNGTQVWCLLTTDTTISTDTAVLTVTDMTISIDPDTLILTIPTDPLFSGYQWYCKDSLISGETSNKITLSIDSTEYINKNIYYCKVWNAVGDTVTSKTWSLKFLLSGVPNTWNSIMLRLRAGFH